MRIPDDAELMALIRAIAAGDAAAHELLAAAPELAKQKVRTGATRVASLAFFLEEIRHHIYADDTALHIAGAAHRPKLAQALLDAGANVRARNRRGAEPLHYAADGSPGAAWWNPTNQAATIACLISAGADPNALDKSGVAPLHRAVRTRSADAVRALLEGGANPKLANKSGSTPLDLATQTTGKSGSGSPEAKAQQQVIIRLLTVGGSARGG